MTLSTHVCNIVYGDLSIKNTSQYQCSILLQKNIQLICLKHRFSCGLRLLHKFFLLKEMVLKILYFFKWKFPPLLKVEHYFFGIFYFDLFILKEMDPTLLFLEITCSSLKTSFKKSLQKTYQNIVHAELWA